MHKSCRYSTTAWWAVRGTRGLGRGLGVKGTRGEGTRVRRGTRGKGITYPVIGNEFTYHGNRRCEKGPEYTNLGPDVVQNE